MVARIGTGRRISEAIRYNELKIKKGKACLLSAKNFVVDSEHLRLTDKMIFFKKRVSLNHHTKVNLLHISLNFDPSEKLADRKLTEIADRYMELIGFGDQPFLVYRHDDSGHPHIHIVSTNIKSDGSRIGLHNIGRNQSESARKTIEKEFRLEVAEGRKIDRADILKPVNVEKIIYGKSETKQAISDVLGLVIDQYCYCSLAELNVMLELYNVKAERGKPGSRMYERGGLIFYVLNDKGKKVSTPLKASLFYMKPTLKNLEIKFKQNEEWKLLHKDRLKNSIDTAFSKTPCASLDQLIDNLRKEKVEVVLKRNEAGLIYGITYLDHQTKCIFNGSDLEKRYSHNAILQRTAGDAGGWKMEGADGKETALLDSSPVHSFLAADQKELIKLELTTDSNAELDFVPSQLKKRRKHKRRKQTSYGNR